MTRGSSGSVIPGIPLFLVLIFSYGCDSSTDPPVEITFDASVQVLVLEGPNAYLLQRLDSQQAYYPLNLPSEFRVEGARVRVEALLIREYHVFLHPPVEILSITSLPEAATISGAGDRRPVQTPVARQAYP